MKKEASKKSVPVAPKVQPADYDQIQDRIRRRAYELWEQGGYVHGRDGEHWLKAEMEITGNAATKNFPE